MSNKMNDVFDLPVSDSQFTLVAMAKSTYMSMDKAAVIAINAYDANQDRIAELEKGYEELRIAALYAVCKMSGGQAKADLRDAYDKATEQLEALKEDNQ
jgi:hypothetical protein